MNHGGKAVLLLPSFPYCAYSARAIASEQLGSKEGEEPTLASFFGVTFTEFL